ncbi:hypothetical protein CVT24_006472 [Panaeolus cyanescens]|uniref:Uncharacterized protein n=1 Tax=Panaeolus cyanescens TaxID=181874 RepID=A0A409VZ23_9AGAR|nr:hypothetical protein CVT24_006472 [Panaeolus cyanescens]
MTNRGGDSDLGFLFDRLKLENPTVNDLPQVFQLSAQSPVAPPSVPSSSPIENTSPSLTVNIPPKPSSVLSSALPSNESSSSPSQTLPGNGTNSQLATILKSDGLSFVQQTITQTTLATQTVLPDALSPSPISPDPVTSGDGAKHASLPSGAIIGAITGGILLTVFVIVVCIRRKRQRLLRITHVNFGDAQTSMNKDAESPGFLGIQSEDSFLIREPFSNSGHIRPFTSAQSPKSGAPTNGHKGKVERRRTIFATLQAESTNTQLSNTQMNSGISQTRARNTDICSDSSVGHARSNSLQSLHGNQCCRSRRTEAATGMNWDDTPPPYTLTTRRYSTAV